MTLSKYDLLTICRSCTRISCMLRAVGKDHHDKVCYNCKTVTRIHNKLLDWEGA